MTRRFSINALASRLAMIAAFVLTGCSDDKSHNFDRLEHARVYMKDHHAEFETMVRFFIAKQNLDISFANFPLDERTVINFEIDLDKSNQTFLTIDNLINKDIFDIGCYSHEGEAKWRPFCSSFISDARDQLGYDKVEIVPKR